MCFQSLEKKGLGKFNFHWCYKLPIFDKKIIILRDKIIVRITFLNRNFYRELKSKICIEFFCLFFIGKKDNWTLLLDDVFCISLGRPALILQFVVVGCNVNWRFVAKA